MLGTVIVACLAAVVVSVPTEFKKGLDGSPLVIEYDVGTHQHIQTGDAGNAVRGSYSYFSTDGTEHTVNYIADEKGYRVVGGTTFSTINRPAAPAQAALVPAATEPLEVAEPIDIAEPIEVTEPAVPIAVPVTEAELLTVSEPVTEPTVTEPAVTAEPDVAQLPAEPREPIGAFAVASVPQKLLPITYGSYPYSQFQGYYPYRFSSALPYYPSGYTTLPVPYGYGYNPSTINGYVLRPVKVNNDGSKSTRSPAVTQSQLQAQYRKQLEAQKQFQLYQGSLQQNYPYGKFFVKVPKQKLPVQSSA